MLGEFAEGENDLLTGDWKRNCFLFPWPTDLERKDLAWRTASEIVSWLFAGFEINNSDDIFLPTGIEDVEAITADVDEEDKLFLLVECDK